MQVLEFVIGVAVANPVPKPSGNGEENKSDRLFLKTI
jgi:hypothetical protein